jgi:cytochrome c-type biogenesis protein CcmH/NrfF
MHLFLPSRGGKRAARPARVRTLVALPLLTLLILASGASIWAQTEAQIESDEVKRVGSHLSCQCGACQENLNCMMSAGQCHFCKPARTTIYEMQSKGMSDQAIVASFVKQYGEKIFRKDPNSYFWIVPYLSLGLGCLAIVFILRRVYGQHPMKPAVAGGAPHIDDPDLARYREAIEKDTERLD